MDNKFFKNINDDLSFKLFLKNIYDCKVGFYSVGLYPASLAYNCAMHSKNKNILLAPRPGRNLLGAFSEEILVEMDKEIIDRIIKMSFESNSNKKKTYNLADLILKCDIVFLASNSNHIQDDIYEAIQLRRKLKKENVLFACLVGSFCTNNNDPFILCDKYPDLAFFTGFHRHGALRNRKDSFTANFCHPDSLTALIGAKILNQLSPNIQVSPGVHNIECQYIKAIKNVSSIFAGFVNHYHEDKPGMLPTINTILLSQCFDQAACVSSVVRKKRSIDSQLISLEELGYGVEIIKGQKQRNKKIYENMDYTFSQLNAVTADVLGSMSLPTIGKPTRNFQAGQVLADMLNKLERCPKDIEEFVEWCNKFSLSQGGLEGLKSLRFWPNIYKRYGISNNICSMINLLYLSFYGNNSEKKDIYNVLIDSQEITNYCRESVMPKVSIEMRYKLLGTDIFKDYDLFYDCIFSKKTDIEQIKINRSKLEIEKDSRYIKVLRIVNKYFKN